MASGMEMLLNQAVKALKIDPKELMGKVDIFLKDVQTTKELMMDIHRRVVALELPINRADNNMDLIVSMLSEIKDSQHPAGAATPGFYEVERDANGNVTFTGIGKEEQNGIERTGASTEPTAAAV